MDLAKADPRVGSRPQRTFRQDTTLPRGNTESPDRVISAQINRPDTSDADALARILGLADEVGQNIAGDFADKKNKEDAAAGAADSAAQAMDPQRFAKVKVYREAYQLQGAKKLAIDIGNEATRRVTDRLNDSDNPATISDIDHVIEDVFQKHVTDQNGKVLDFGTPEAKMVLANSLNEVRSNLLPQALATIKKQTDERLMATVVSNKLVEYSRGAPIGAPPRQAPLPDALAPLPDAQVVPPTGTYYAPANAKPLAPFAGFGEHITSRMGAPREGGSVHNGEDFAVPSGTPIVAPMHGEVIASFSNARGGNQVRVKMADGAIVGFAHLSSRGVNVGDRVDGGQQLGLSGQTGHATGPHVHMTVEVGGKKVSPSQYFANASVPSRLPSGPSLVSTASDPQLTQGTPPSTMVGTALPPFDFEGAMKDIPTTVSRATAKAYILQSLINTANERHDIGLLQGLEDSKRKDGTPSLSPDEVANVIQARDQITDRVRVQAEQARKQLWDKNSDQILLAFESDNKPSIGFIRNAAHQGLIDPNTAFSLENWMVNQQQEATREARSEARQAKAEADAAILVDVSSRVALRNAGDLNGASVEEDNALLTSGQLGTGKTGLANYRMLRAAARAGEQENLKNPDVALYAGKLKNNFGKPATGLVAKALSGGDANFVGIIGLYRSEVAKGTEPAQAYYDVVQKFQPKSKEATALRQQRILELRAKRLGN
jgi:murein DD-endopeptidase MepM/ murein hydrolase activator NlpD